MIRKVLIGGVAAAGLFAISGAPALAFECYNATRPDNGNAHAANGEALMSFEELLADPNIVGLCPAGIDFVIAGVEEEGFRTDVLINFHALMAGGLERNGKGEEKLHDGRAIDHLGAEFFEVADPLVEEAFGICFD